MFQLPKIQLNKKTIIAFCLLLVFIVSCVIGVMQYTKAKKEQQLVEDITYICEAFNTQDFSWLSEVLDYMEEPYRSYYSDFYDAYVYIQTWYGTGPELIAYLDELYEYGRRQGYYDLEFPDDIPYSRGFNPQCWYYVKYYRETWREISLQYRDHASYHTGQSETSILDNVYYDSVFTGSEEAKEYHRSLCDPSKDLWQVIVKIFNYEMIGNIIDEY